MKRKTVNEPISLGKYAHVFRLKSFENRYFTHVVILKEVRTGSTAHLREVGKSLCDTKNTVSSKSYDAKPGKCKKHS